MISPESRSRGWLFSVCERFNTPDVALVDKVIRAFSLLEALARSGCPFIFKGGSCLMLHFNTEKRLSIDIDIICPPGTRIEDYWDKYVIEYGFCKPEPLHRESRTNVPKEHAKFNYQVAYSDSKPDSILLDVLLEDSPYEKLEEKPIVSPLLKTEGENILVRVPSKIDMLADKLTAYAPNTTGIPFVKKNAKGQVKICSLEIAKQMFDVASLFDAVDDLNEVLEIYKKIAAVELDYRKMAGVDYKEVLRDSINTSLCLGTRGATDKEKFALLTDGISKLRGYIYNDKYSVDRAITDSAKVAYLAACLQKGQFAPSKYHMEMADAAKKSEIDSSLDTDSAKWTKLNKLKKSNIEAFYYWFRTFELLKN